MSFERIEEQRESVDGLEYEDYRERIRARTCKHVDVCAKCHEYLYCEGKPPSNQWARFFDEGTA